jgi:hypothetical protein
MGKIFTRIWNDPVWSKVIAAIIVALLAAFWAGVHFDWWPQILVYRIPLWVVVLPVAIGLIGWLIWMRRGKIEIVSVRHLDVVAFQQTISGVMTNPTLQVELRVFAGNVWHKQGKVDIVGRNWRGKCQFGNDPTKPIGQRFNLVAIAPKTALADKMPTLPQDAVKSEIITVIRSS